MLHFFNLGSLELKAARFNFSSPDFSSFSLSLSLTQGGEISLTLFLQCLASVVSSVDKKKKKKSNKKTRVQPLCSESCNVFKISRGWRLKSMILCDGSALSPLQHLSPSAACGGPTPTRRWMSTARASCRVLSSFGLNSLGRSKESDEHHQACQTGGGEGGLFNRRDISPCQPGRWLNQHCAAGRCSKVLQLFLFSFFFFDLWRIDCDGHTPGSGVTQSVHLQGYQSLILHTDFPGRRWWTRLPDCKAAARSTCGLLM